MENTLSSQRNIKMLKRRRDFLMSRVSRSDKDLSFDKSEAKALTEAIDVLEALSRKPWLKRELYGSNEEV